LKAAKAPPRTIDTGKAKSLGNTRIMGIATFASTAQKDA
jgi:hypothetical protein